MRHWLFLLLFAQTAFGLPIGNPAGPALYDNGTCCGDPCNLFTWRESVTLSAGFCGDYVYNRHLFVQTGVEGANNIKNYTSAINAGVLTFNVCGNVQFSAILGTNSSQMLLNGGAFSTETTLIEMFFDTAFTWGISAQGVLWNPGNFFVGAGTQYQRHRPRLKKMERHESADVMHFSANNPALYEDWQVSLGAAYRYEAVDTVLTPFIAIKASGGNFNFGNFEFVFDGTTLSYTLKTLRPRKLWGYGVGLSAVLGKRVGATAEVRLADEKALTVNGQFRF